MIDVQVFVSARPLWPFGFTVPEAGKYLYLALLKSHIQQRIQGIIVQISTNVVQNVVQSLCIAEQKLGAGRDNRSHCRSGYLPDTLERFEKKHRRSNLNRGTT